MLDSLTNSISSPMYVMEANKGLKRFVAVDIKSDPLSLDEVVNSLVSIEGELDVYTWYEGPTIITKLGAQFLKEKLFEPLYNRKTNAKLLLYSLEAWNFQRNVNAMYETTPKGIRINSINKAFIECIYASSFFKFCTQYNQESSLYRLVNKELLRKQWLVELSANRNTRGITVEELFEQQPTLVDCIKEWDVSQSYSILQYLEGYYLVKEALVRGLEKEKQKIQVAFVLPNDEAKYYQDLPDDIEKLLKAEFSEKLNGLELNIYFRFYRYGPTVNSRIYLGPMQKGLNVRDSEIENYFNYIPKVDPFV